MSSKKMFGYKDSSSLTNRFVEDKYHMYLPLVDMFVE